MLISVVALFVRHVPSDLISMILLVFFENVFLNAQPWNLCCYHSSSIISNVNTK